MIEIVGGKREDDNLAEIIMCHTTKAQYEHGKYEAEFSKKEEEFIHLPRETMDQKREALSKIPAKPLPSVERLKEIIEECEIPNDKLKIDQIIVKYKNEANWSVRIRLDSIEWI